MSDAADQLREAYLAELLSMWGVLFVLLFWLCALVHGYLRARRDLRQLQGDRDLRRGLPAAKRYGLLREDIR